MIFGSYDDLFVTIMIKDVFHKKGEHGGFWMMLDSILKVVRFCSMRTRTTPMATFWLHPVHIQVQQKHIFGPNNWAYFSENIFSLYTKN